jgi:hypothetical protein
MLHGRYDPGYQALKRLVRKKKTLSPELSLAEEVLYEFTYCRGAQLTDFKVRDAVHAAQERNDRRFFRRLGKALSKPPMLTTRIVLPALARFLVFNWAEPRGEIPALYQLTPDGLTEVCKHQLGNEQITRDQVVKLRQRLGLRPFKRCKLDVIRVGKRLRFRQVDRSS